MSLRKVCILLFCISACFSYAQPYNQWAWIKGDTASLASPVFGTQSVSSGTNFPGAIYEGAKWQDNKGDFWFYGGQDKLGANYSSMWRYTPTTNEWTWMSGPNTKNQPKVFGTKGVADPTVTPGSNFCMPAWTDANGTDLWLMLWGDMFKYNTLTNLWTWMSGPGTVQPPGFWGVKGVSSASTTPGTRLETTATFTDNNGDFWLFGGAKGSFFYSDLWKYNTSTLQWTWMSGDSVPNFVGNYGTKGVAAATNRPSGRYIHTAWFDSNNNFFYIYGGYLFFYNPDLSSNEFDYDDLWRYDLNTDEWTFLEGTFPPLNKSFPPVVAGAPCTSSSNYRPGQGIETKSTWIDDCGNLWMWKQNGGLLNATSGTNALWYFDISISQWVFVKGNTPPSLPLPSFSPMGVFSPTNLPPVSMGAAAWRTNDSLFLLASRTGGLWLYKPDKPTASFVFNTSCNNVTFTNNSIGNCGSIKNYFWDFGDGTTSISKDPTHLYSTSGNHVVKLVITNCFGIKDSITQNINTSSSINATISNIINPLCNGSFGSVSVSITGGVSGTYTYSWNNGTGVQSVVNNTTTQQLTNLTNGTYTVTIIDGSCSTTSTVAIVVPSAINPGIITPTAASCGQNNGSATALAATGGTGTLTYTWSDLGNTTGLTLSNVASGTYTITIKDSNNCTITSTTIINSIGGASISSITPTNPLCNNQTGSAIVTISNGTSGTYTYSWNNGTGVQSIVNNSTTQQLINLTNGTYTVTVIDGSCTSSGTVAITAPPAISFTAVQSSSSSCNLSNGVASITISNATANYTYSYSNGTSSQSTISSNATTTISNLSSGTYTITVSDGSACTATTTLSITQSETLTINVSATAATCNQTNGSIQINTSGGTAPYTYSYTDGTNAQSAVNNLVTQQFNNLKQGNYTLTITDNNNCSITTTAIINNTAVTANALASSTAKSNTINEGEIVVLSAVGGVSFSWTPSSLVACPTCAVTNASPPQTTTYTLVAVDNNGCTDNDTITIKVRKGCANESDVYIANVFSPGTTLNGILTVQGSGLSNIYFTIFDRWGNQVFESRDQSQGWDGTVNGNKVNAGTYVYYLKATCKKTLQEVILKGNVSIVR